MEAEFFNCIIICITILYFFHSIFLASSTVFYCVYSLAFSLVSRNSPRNIGFYRVLECA